jgi:hypothetical protein
MRIAVIAGIAVIARDWRGLFLSRVLFPMSAMTLR